MSLLKFVFFFVSTVEIARGGTVNSGVQNAECIIPIGSKQNYLAQWPLVYNSKSGELYSTVIDSETDEKSIVIKAGEEILLSCGPNYFKQFGRKEVLDVQCNGATGNFTINRNEKPARDLTCDLRVIEEVVGGIPGCTDATSRFGYVDPSKKKAIILGEACYDMNVGITKFVHIKLGDASNSYLEEQPKSYLTTLRHPDGRYKIELFRGLNFDEIYERIRSSLHLRHAPQLKIAHFVDDPLLGNSQFQAIKKLGWNYFVGYDENETLEKLKSNIKELSQNKNLDIYIGTHGIKELYGNDNSKMAIYLHENPKRFPMPNLLWFIVRSEEKATAFGIWNDDDSSNSLPEIEKGLSKNAESFCINGDCKKISWLFEELKQNKKLICCDVNEFRQNVPEIPIISHIHDMLE